MRFKADMTAVRFAEGTLTEADFEDGGSLTAREVSCRGADLWLEPTTVTEALRPPRKAESRR